MLCGNANMQLGYLILADQMFQKALAFRSYEAPAYKSLGELYVKQD
jgi:hypothetical protein